MSDVSDVFVNTVIAILVKSSGQLVIFKIIDIQK